MQGEEGVWADILKGLEEDPNGPQINLRKEIIELLNTRVLGMTKYQQPITPQSENIVYAVELKDGKEAGLKKAFEKLFANDSEMQKIEYKSHILWHRVPQDDLILPSNDIAITPAAGSSAPAKKEESDSPPAFPDIVFTAANNCLFFSTHFEYIKVILDRLDKNDVSISDNSEYKEVNAAFAALGMTGKEHFLQIFSRSDEAVMPTYELTRMGKMPLSQTVFGKLLNVLFSSEDENNGTGVRKQLLDGSKLPPFDKVKQYFGPAGIFGASEDNGYFIKGFVLEKKTESSNTSKKEIPKNEDVKKPEPKRMLDSAVPSTAEKK